MGQEVLAEAGVTREQLLDAIDRSINPRELVRFSTIRRTALARKQLGLAGPFSPLHPREVRGLSMDPASVLTRYSWLK